MLLKLVNGHFAKQVTTCLFTIAPESNNILSIFGTLLLDGTRVIQNSHDIGVEVFHEAKMSCGFLRIAHLTARWSKLLIRPQKCDNSTSKALAMPTVRVRHTLIKGKPFKYIKLN